MSFFERIEQACAQFIERTFAKSFPSDVEPAQIARKLVATMEAQTRGEDGRPSAPSVYAVYVSTADFERLEEHREYLEEAWIDLLRDLAAKVGIAFVDGDPRVTMSARPSVPLGAIAIEVGDAARASAQFALRMIKGLPVDGVYSITGTTRVGRGDESEIVLLDPATGQMIRQYPTLESGETPGWYVANLRASPDGSKLAMVTYSLLGVDIRDSATGKLLYRLPEEPGTIWWLAWSPDDSWLAVSRANGDISIWNLKEVGRQVSQLESAR